MAYEIVTAHCQKGTCPTIHVDRVTGKVAVQGYLTGDAIQTPDGETAVEMPVEVFESLVKEYLAREGASA